MNHPRTLTSICAHTFFDSDYLCFLKFIIVSWMTCHSMRWAHCRCRPVCTVGTPRTGWGFTLSLSPKGPRLRFCLDPGESLARQLSVWPVALNSSGTVTLDPMQGRQSQLPGFTWHCQWKYGAFKIHQWKDLQWNQLSPTDKRGCWQKKLLAHTGKYWMIWLTH